MASINALSEKEIKSWVGGRSFERGRAYYHDNSIQRPRRRGNTLAADCYGSMSQPYRVEITLQDGAIAFGDCSCPVGDGGHCKHAAALLLTWLHAPQRFVELESVTKSLSGRSKEALIYLIERMLERHPDLEDILELPSVAAGQAPQGTIDEHLIRRQIENLLVPYADEYGYGYDYQAGRHLQQGLKPIMEVGASYLVHGDWAKGMLVFQTIITELLPQLNMFHDESDDVFILISDCVTQLGACLAAADPQEPGAAEARHSMLRTFFEVQMLNIEQGGVGLGEDIAEIVAAGATAAEKETMAGWVAAALPEMEEQDEDSWSRGWRRKAYGGWLLKLQEEALDDERYLEICRQTGRTVDLVERLLQLGRLREAIHAAQEANDYTLLQLAERFVFHGQAAVATDLVWERTAASNDRRLEEWLRQRAVEAGNRKEALQISERLFWQHTSLERYQEIQELAEQLGQWEQRRRVIHNRLAEQGAFIRLTEIHLFEDNVAAALGSLQQAESQPQPFYSYVPRLEVAEAAESSHPQEAIRLYLAEAEKRINARGRENYKEAAKLLAQVKKLYETRLADGRAWEQLIQRIREEYRTLRALKEELDRAGL